MQHSDVVNVPSKTFHIAGLNTSYAMIPSKRPRGASLHEQIKSGMMNGTPLGIEALMTAYKEGKHGWSS